MKAIHFLEKGRAAIAEAAIGDVPAGHVLIRVKAAGLCHTDIEVLQARYGVGRFPLIPGHEYAGEVVAVGANVEGVTIGSRVAVNPNLACGVCPACQKGLSNLCADLKAYGVTENGGFSEYSIVRSDHVHDIGDMPYSLAALAEPLACVLNGLGAAAVIDDRRTQRPKRALCFGAGPIGLLLGLALQSNGFEDVSMADIDPSRLEFAAGMGLNTVASGSRELDRQYQAFDLVADATGIPQVVENMIRFVADGGTALVFGVCPPASRVAISPFEIFRRQIKIAGSHSLNNNIPEALAVLAADQARLSKLVTHRLSLEEMVPYFLSKPTDSATMKVQYVDA